MNAALSITLLFSESNALYAESLAALFCGQGIAVVSRTPEMIAPAAEEIGDYLFPFQKSEYLVILLCEKMQDHIYRIPGLRANLDAAVTASPAKMFIVMTDTTWMPGFQSEQIYIDLHARNAMPIAREILAIAGNPVADGVFEEFAPPAVVRNRTGEIAAGDYLSELCALSEYAGVIAFGALLYEQGQQEIIDVLTTQSSMARIDLAAGPHLDLFAIADTAISQTTPSESGEPDVRSSSAFLESFLGISNVQINYPSFMIFLIERQRFAHTALVPIIYVDPETFHEKWRLLIESIADGLRNWRIDRSFRTKDLWMHLVQTLGEKSYPVVQYPSPADTAKAISHFAQSIQYF